MTRYEKFGMMHIIFGMNIMTGEGSTGDAFYLTIGLILFICGSILFFLKK